MIDFFNKKLSQTCQLNQLRKKTQFVIQDCVALYWQMFSSTLLDQHL